MKVSIIIPVKEINHYIVEGNRHLLGLDYDDFEIIVLPDRDTGVRLPCTRIIATGPLGPAEKRDLGARYAKGEVLAFLDDDAYPSREWLKKAVRHFKDSGVGAVGGPGITPSDNSFMQKASGAVLSSWLTSAGYIYRYIPTTYREVDDFPSVNLFVRKELFERVGGFDTGYWPGEDTKLCLDIKKMGLKIIYDPEVLVYHHRRPLFLPHLKQIARYAFQRGYFVKVFPDTSRRPAYFVPSAFLVLLVVGTALSTMSTTFFLAYSGVITIYTIALVTASVTTVLSTGDVRLGITVIPGIFLTHIIYGYNFLRGLLSTKSKDYHRMV